MNFLYTVIGLLDVMLPCPKIAHEGALWFPDLTVADPTLILPFAVGIINLSNIEVSKLLLQ